MTYVRLFASPISSVRIFGHTPTLAPLTTLGSKCRPESRSLKASSFTRAAFETRTIRIPFHTFTSLRTPVPPPKIKLLPKLPAQLRENVWNVPNLLTFSRLLASPVIGYLILHDSHVAALSLFAIAGVTDLVDGWIARTWKLQTVVGSVIDPMADKTLMTILTVCLAVKGGLPVWVAGVILGRDVGLAISALWWRWISLPPPKTMARYWDFGLPSAEVRPTEISKINTALQLALIGACVVNPLIAGGGEWEAALEALQYTVATSTVWSGLSYVFSKDAVKIIKHPPPSGNSENEESK